jgi:hypothetical protein
MSGKGQWVLDYRKALAKTKSGRKFVFLDFSIHSGIPGFSRSDIPAAATGRSEPVPFGRFRDFDCTIRLP